MQIVKGTLLQKKMIQTKKGGQIPVISVLDKNTKFSQVLDITDFDNHFGAAAEGQEISVPVRIRPGVSDKGRAYLNFVTDGVMS